MTERKGSIIGKISGEIGLASFPTEVIHTQNFERAKEHLKTGSVLLYFNHIDTYDLLVLGKTIREHLTSLDHVSAMFAMKYLDANRDKGSKIKSIIIHSWEESFGITALPIVQTKESETEIYPNAKEINRDSINKAMEILQQPGNVLCVAPEGTRSTTGGLLQAERGFELLLRRSQETALAQPIAVIHTKIKPIVTRTRIFIPESFTYNEIKAEQEANPGVTITDLAMKRIAAELPSQNRGFYR